VSRRSVTRHPLRTRPCSRRISGRCAWFGAESAQSGAPFFGSLAARGRRERLPTLGGGFLLVVAAAGTDGAERR
jgi:hypothetical protein